MALRIRRTVSSGPPTGLQEGQLAVEMGPGALWVGVPTGVDPSGRKQLARSPQAGDVTGPPNATVVERIRGRNVSATAPTIGQALGWDGTNWTPSAPPSAQVFPAIYNVTGTIVGSRAVFTATIPGWTLADRGVIYLRGNWARPSWQAWQQPLQININTLGARDLILMNPGPQRVGLIGTGGTVNTQWSPFLGARDMAVGTLAWLNNQSILICHYDGTVFRQIDSAFTYDYISQALTGVAPQNSRHDRNISNNTNISMSPNPITLLRTGAAYTGNVDIGFNVWGVGNGNPYGGSVWYNKRLSYNGYSVHNRRYAGQTRKLIVWNQHPTTPTLRIVPRTQTWHITMGDSPNKIFTSSYFIRVSRRVRTITGVSVASGIVSVQVPANSETEFVYRINQATEWGINGSYNSWQLGLAFPKPGYFPDYTWGRSLRSVIDILDINVWENA